MKISREDLIRVNNGFGGKLINGADLDFALKQQNNVKLGDYKKLAYLFRAILVDHLFSDGNKRTAMFLAIAFADECKKEIDMDLLKHHVLSIASKNITIADQLNSSMALVAPLNTKPTNKNRKTKLVYYNIRNVEWRLKNAVK